MSSVVISVEDLAEITNEVWGSLLDPGQECPLLPFPVDGASEVSATVSVTGAWRGHVVVECSGPASRLVAATLLSVEAGVVTGEDVADALGELANVIGGNVKSLLPGPSALSLPQVTLAASADTRWLAVTEICRLAGSWLDEPVSISVLQSSTAEQAGTTAA
jgi:chemotaxis protein CheX